jgi:hypothetical protein
MQAEKNLNTIIARRRRNPANLDHVNQIREREGLPPVAEVDGAEEAEGEEELGET